MPNNKKQADFNPIEVRVTMLRMQITSSRLAKRFKVSHRALNAALAGHGNMSRLRGRIVKHLEKKSA